MRRSYVVPMRRMVIYECEVPAGALNLSSTKLPRPWSSWESSPSKKSPHGSAGNRTRNLMISSQKLWPLDHEAGLCLYYNFMLITEKIIMLICTLFLSNIDYIKLLWMGLLPGSCFLAWFWILSSSLLKKVNIRKCEQKVEQRKQTIMKKWRAWQWAYALKLGRNKIEVFGMHT
jgi:hypothetical protein